MARPKVPHCTTCKHCFLSLSNGAGARRYCTGQTSGPPIPILDRERRHTSPRWCPERYGSVIRLEYELAPQVVAPRVGGTE